MPWYGTIAVAVALIAGCSSSSIEVVKRPDESRLVSRIRPDRAGEILIAEFYTGGGGGDTTYRLLACRNTTGKCEILGGIDTRGSAAPTLLGNREVELLVNTTDTIWNFSNVTSYSQSGTVRRIRLRYRP